MIYEFSAAANDDALGQSNTNSAPAGGSGSSYTPTNHSSSVIEGKVSIKCSDKHFYIPQAGEILAVK
jgi:hypothetical protein